MNWPTGRNSKITSSSAVNKPHHIFLYGLPHVGKTTAIERIVQTGNRSWRGFLTGPFFENGKKAGIQIITHQGNIHQVARKNQSSGRNATYALDEKVLHDAISDAFSSIEAGMRVYMDEINSLFCRMDFFRNEVRRLMDIHAVVAVVSRKGHPFLHTLWRRPDVDIFEVRSDNRDELPALVLHQLEKLS